MHKIALVITVGLAMGMLTGCGNNDLPREVREAAEGADQFVLYSLDPHELFHKLAKVESEEGWGVGEPEVAAKPGEDEGAEAKVVKRFTGGWMILGEVEITDQAKRDELMGALREAAQANDGMVAGCFIPRHGLRIVKGEETWDLVICFECLQMMVYLNDKKMDSVLITEIAQPTFDAALREAGVELGDRDR